MSEEVTIADAGPKVKAGSVFGGVAFMVFWAVVHVVCVGVATPLMCAPMLTCVC